MPSPLGAVAIVLEPQSFGPIEAGEKCLHAAAGGLAFARYWASAHCSAHALQQ